MILLRYNLYREGRTDAVLRIMSWYPRNLQRGLETVILSRITIFQVPETQLHRGQSRPGPSQPC